MQTKTDKAQLKELKHAELWAAYWRDPDSSDTLSKLVEAWTPLVRRVVERVSIRLPSSVAVEDLVQSGVLGLYQAIERFNPDQNQHFEAFAYHRIRGSVLDELRSMDHMSRTRRAQIKRVEDAIRTWMEKHGETPEEHQLAEAVGMSVHDLTRLLDQAQPWISLDRAVAGLEGDGQPLSEIIADPRSTIPDKEAEREDLRKQLRQSFLKLSMREQRVLYLYYFEELRLSEIAKLFELTEARICQIHSLSVSKLKAILSRTHER